MTAAGRVGPLAPGAHLLALDTSTRGGSVAVGRDGSVLGAATLGGDARHASGLVPAIERVLADAKLTREDISGVLVGAGPGSFTGVRIAAATAKGLVAGLGVRFFAASSLAAAALSVPGRGLRHAVFDARSDRVYAACYDVGDAAVRTVVEPWAGTIDQVVGAGVAGHVLVGDGAERHRGLLEAAGGTLADSGPSSAMAEGLLRYAALVDGLAPVDDVQRWEPSYLRAWASGAA